MSVSWRDGITLTVEAALSASTGSYGAWDAATWDTATWGPDVIWTDITTWLRKFAINRRFSRDLQAWEAGTATIVLDNRDGRFSPDNTTGPYVSSGVTQIRPWRPVRIRVGFAGTTYNLYRGYGLEYKETTALAPVGKGDAYVTIPATDELAALARFNGLATAAVGAGETTGARIHRILNNAGHTGDRNIANGLNTCQATTLANDAVTDLKLTADSEGGALWVDADGTVMFADRQALLESSRSNTIQATFGDGGGTELPYRAAEPVTNGDLMVNIASWARVGGTAVTSTDETSRALYRDKRSTRTDLVCETDTQVKTLTDLWVARYGNPERRVPSIEVTPRRAPATLYPVVLGLKVRDLVRVIRRPPGGYTSTVDCFVAGISHTVTANPADWITRFDLWSATGYTGFNNPLWDGGLWDTAKWFF